MLYNSYDEEIEQKYMPIFKDTKIANVKFYKQCKTKYGPSYYYDRSNEKRVIPNDILTEISFDKTQLIKNTKDTFHDFYEYIRYVQKNFNKWKEENNNNPIYVEYDKISDNNGINKNNKEQNITSKGQININGHLEGPGERIVYDDKGNKTIYLGDFKENEYDGCGKLTYADGTTYQGQFKQDNKHGYGIFENKYFQYNGFFKDDELNGEGTLICENNKAISTGIWQNNKLTNGNIKCEDCEITVTTQKKDYKPTTTYSINGVNVDWEPQYDGNFQNIFRNHDGNFNCKEYTLTWQQKNGNTVKYTAYWKDNKVDTTKNSTLVVIDNTTGKELYSYKNYYPIINRKDISTDKPLILVPKFYKNKDIAWPSCFSLDCCQENFANSEIKMP